MDMMVFSDSQLSSVEASSRRFHSPKRWIIVLLFFVLVGGFWWIMQPSNKHTGSSSGTSIPDGVPNISGTITDLDGQALAASEIKVADSEGNPIRTADADQSGQYKLYLPNGVYIFSITAKGEQLIKQVKVSKNSPKKIDIQMNITSQY